MDKTTTPFWRQIVLVLFGITLALCFLETGLRTIGFILKHRQEHRNRLSLKQTGTYRIMCIGESTTQGQYPPFLEEILNKADTGMKFSVIDEGIGATNTSIIVSVLEENLKKYNPDLVVAMIGINDGAAHMPAGFNSSSRFSIHSLKIYKLTQLLSLRVRNKIKKVGDNRRRDTAPAISLGNRKTLQNNAAGRDVISDETPEIAAESKKELSASYYADLGEKFAANRQTDLACQAFKKVIELNPYDIWPYFRICWLSFGSAEGEEGLEKLFQLYKELVETNRLNRIKDPVLISTFGTLFAKRKEFQKKLEELFSMILTKDPQNITAHNTLGRIFLNQGRYTAAEGHFLEVIKLNGKDSGAYDTLALLYHDTGKQALSEYYGRKANELRDDYYPILTIVNFKRIKAILDAHRVKLVCVQYPLRKVEYLKKMFADENNIVFVDNESVFRNALKKTSYTDLFCDMFAGDFRHCTEEGNKLLAKNIADVILKEIFGRESSAKF